MKIYTSFPEGKSKVLTMSYDDGKPQDERLVPLFNKYGIRGTFNLNYGLMGMDKSIPRLPAERIKELYQGHEVATHTMTHPTIARCPLTEVAKEILEDRIGLESLVGTLVRGHAYPNGSYSEEIKQLFRQMGIVYARLMETSGEFELPTDYMEWKATCHHNDPQLMEKAKFFAEFKKPQYLKIMYVWGHSYEFDRDDNWNVIEEFCEYMGGRDDIWYATNIEIVDYMTAAKNLRYTADGNAVFNPNACSIWLQLEGSVVAEVPGGAYVDLRTFL
ncbi:MAG: polysaccharide deacetylase family protein [Clostridium sp.]|nr:polysaccharide deacetylase family protein [Acetatifactor muris]MCM1528299.1 polysaccharide deacetylase family protein [Bacteroides sp.]MCM1563679.1 polysaccharide deacetylase family protein [Clostridium sp.]